MNVALDKLRDISRKSDEDKISRLRQELHEANERISQVAEFSMEAIQDCNKNIDRIKKSIEIIQNQSVSISNHTSQQSGDNAVNKQAGEINE